MLNMVDGVLLLVDAKDGPKPQAGTAKVLHLARSSLRGHPPLQKPALAQAALEECLRRLVADRGGAVLHGLRPGALPKRRRAGAKLAPS